MTSVSGSWLLNNGIFYRFEQRNDFRCFKNLSSVGSHKKQDKIQLYIYKLYSTKHCNMLFSGNRLWNVHSTQRRFLLYKIQIIWIQFTQNCLDEPELVLNFQVFTSIRESWTGMDGITYLYKAILALPKVFRLPHRQVGDKS